MIGVTRKGLYFFIAIVEDDSKINIIIQDEKETFTH